MPRQKSGGVNKSEAIRQVYAKNPNIEVKDVIAQLDQNGINVQPTLVYYIKARLRRAKRKQIRVKATQVTNGVATNPIEVIRKVKTLALDVGGLGRLKQLVDILSE